MTPENDLKFKYQGPLAQFYWNIVLPIGFHGANGAMTAEGSSCDRGLLPTQSGIFAIQPWTEDICRLLQKENHLARSKVCCRGVVG